MNKCIVRFSLTVDDKVLVGIKWADYCHMFTAERLDYNLFEHLASVYELAIPIGDATMVAKDVMSAGNAIRFYESAMAQ